MLIIPYRYDQPGNAIRVCHHGLGTTCFPHDLTTEILVGEIRNLLEAKEILARVTAFQTTFREREKEQVMSGLCEKFLQM